MGQPPSLVVSTIPLVRGIPRPLCSRAIVLHQQSLVPDGSAEDLQQVDLLQQSFLRLGGWNKDRIVYVDIIKELKEIPEFKDEKPWKQLHLPSEWDSKETPSATVGKFIMYEKWEFVRSEEISDSGAIKETLSKPGMGTKRATGNWGLGLSHRFVHGDLTHGRTNGDTNGSGRIAGKKAIATDDKEGYESAEEEVIHVHDKSETVY